MKFSFSLKGIETVTATVHKNITHAVLPKESEDNSTDIGKGTSESPANLTITTSSRGHNFLIKLNQLIVNICLLQLLKIF